MLQVRKELGGLPPTPRVQYQKMNCGTGGIEPEIPGNFHPPNFCDFGKTGNYS